MLGLAGYYAIFVVSTQFLSEVFHASTAVAGLATGIIVIGCLVGRFFTGSIVHSAGYRRVLFCGVVLYLDSENWLKGSIEYENERFQHLGSVVTSQGYSDWATTEIPATIKSMWYRLSRRADDFRIECSEDGKGFKQMRVCHLHKATGAVSFGVYACSPEDSSFKAVFTNMELLPCQWQAHDGQQPDKD